MIDFPFPSLPENERDRRSGNLEWVQKYYADPDALNAQVERTTDAIFDGITGDLSLFRHATHLLTDKMLPEMLKYADHTVWFRALVEMRLHPYAEKHPELGAFYPRLRDALRLFLPFAGRYNPEARPPLSAWDNYDLAEAYAELIDALKYRAAETKRFELLDSAIKVARMHNNPYSINRVREAHVLYLIYQGCVVEACEMGKQVIDQWRELGDIKREIKFAIQLTNLWLVENHLVNARNTYEQIFKSDLHSNQLELVDILKYTYTGALLLQIIDEDYETALAMAEPLIDAYRALEMPYEVAMCEYLCASLLTMLKQYDKALLLYHSAIETYTRLGNLTPLMQCWLNLAWLHRFRDDLYECETALRAAFGCVLMMDAPDAYMVLGNRVNAVAKEYIGITFPLPPLEDEGAPLVMDDFNDDEW